MFVPKHVLHWKTCLGKKQRTWRTTLGGGDLSFNYRMVLECRICCTSLVGTHMWCNQPQLLAWVMSPLFWNGVRSEERTHHSWMDVCRRLCSLAEKEANVTEKWCRCNVSRLNGLSALCLSRLQLSQDSFNVQRAGESAECRQGNEHSLCSQFTVSSN